MLEQLFTKWKTPYGVPSDEVYNKCGINKLELMN